VHPEHLGWPFLDDRHREIGASVTAWLAAMPGGPGPTASTAVDDACRNWVRQLGAAGYLRFCVPAAWGGAAGAVESRS
jgi:hypothetical protein